LLVGAYHLTQVFWVKLAGEYGRVHQVTKQHGELAAFGVCGMWRNGCRGDGHHVALRALSWPEWRRREGKGWWQDGVTSPDSATPCVVDHLRLRVQELVLQGGQLLVIQLEVQLEGPIG
jgi:hypothetical protein